MLHALEIENFRSFADRTRIDLTVLPAKAKDYRYVKTACGVTVSRLAVFFGANASGKSSVARALSHLHWLIAESAFVKDTKDFIPPFPYKGSQKNACFFALEFDLGAAKSYRYEVEVTEAFEVKREYLADRVKPKDNWCTVYERQLLGEEFKFTGETMPAWRLAPQKKTATLISSLIQAGAIPGTSPEARELAQKIVEACDNSFSSVSTGFNAPNPMHSYFRLGLAALKDAALKDGIRDFMTESDTGITDMEVNQVSHVDAKTGQTHNIPFTEFTHNIDGKPQVLNPEQESDGTHQLAIHLADTLPVVDKNGVIVMDEIERSLHPHILPKLVRRMVPHGKHSQAILITHSDYLLRELDRAQIHLIEKTESGRSTCYRADRIKGLKSDRNLFAWYHTGALGAVPRV